MNLKPRSGYKIYNDSVQILNGNTNISSSTHRSRSWFRILRCCFAEDGYGMYKGLLKTLKQPLFCSLNLLFGGAH